MYNVSHSKKNIKVWNKQMEADSDSNLRGMESDSVWWEPYILYTTLLYCKFKVVSLDPTNSNKGIHPRKLDIKT